ncbi:LamG domain-containing protein [Streptomyces daghestanicus]|uniref:LamG domain-containing protein n=2 Tax=Streptomyces daghestanicus TaxID=66885 RepID=UPI001CFAC63F|nr:LamG domain-containing protein [Streptomyces daghestanicus]
MATLTAAPWSPAAVGHPLSRPSTDASAASVAARDGEESPAETPPVAAWRLDDGNGSARAAQWAGSYVGLPGPGVRLGEQGPDGKMPGAAYFDGGDYSYLITEGIAVDTTRAFTVGVWVRPEVTGQEMVAVSQSGIWSAPNFALGATTDGDGKPTWGFALPTADGQVTVTGGTPEAGEWAHLAGVYDPATGSARLYVDGTAVAARDAVVPADTALWHFVMGEALDSDGYTFGQKWRGDLADVRVWNADVPAAELAELGRRKPRPFAYWPMESVQTLENGIARIPDTHHNIGFILGGDARLSNEEPLAGSADITLDGDGDHLFSDIPPLNTDRSWAVSTKVRLHGAPDRDMAVLSQTGWQADAFTLRYHAADQTWRAVLAHADSADADTTQLSAPAPGGAQNLLLQYDEKARQVQLYVDGILADSAPYAETDAWQAGSSLQAGRDSAADGVGAHFLDGDNAWRGVCWCAEALLVWGVVGLLRSRVGGWVGVGGVCELGLCVVCGGWRGGL